MLYTYAKSDRKAKKRAFNIDGQIPLYDYFDEPPSSKSYNKHFSQGWDNP